LVGLIKGVRSFW